MQSFQPAPPSQQHPDPFTPQKPSLLQQIKAHKTPIILASLGVLVLTGMITYLVVSPRQKTLVAPANQEPVSAVFPTRIPTDTPTPQPSATPVPTTVSTAWKTYNNSVYNYSIKYPPAWTVRNLGALEPLIPSYVVFNPETASQSARSITISISTRSYTDQLALAASNSATTVGGITGTKQYFRDSDGNTSTVITLPRTNNLLVLRAKTAYLSIFNQMLTTLQTTR